MNDEQRPVIAEITQEARTRCQTLGDGALEAVEGLRAELEKNPALGRQARSAVGGMKLYTTRLEERTPVRLSPSPTSTTPRRPSRA